MRGLGSLLRTLRPDFTKSLTPAINNVSTSRFASVELSPHARASSSAMAARDLERPATDSECSRHERDAGAIRIRRAERPTKILKSATADGCPSTIAAPATMLADAV